MATRHEGVTKEGVIVAPLPSTKTGRHPWLLRGEEGGGGLATFFSRPTGVRGGGGGQ